MLDYVVFGTEYQKHHDFDWYVNQSNITVFA